ncbi:MAG: hypothetical protein H6713_16495 [Myxococcales bacterium]|nr:hypothetical protein [Myxococcales bacterium]
MVLVLEDPEVVSGPDELEASSVVEPVLVLGMSASLDPVAPVLKLASVAGSLVGPVPSVVERGSFEATHAKTPANMQISGRHAIMILAPK